MLRFGPDPDPQLTLLRQVRIPDHARVLQTNEAGEVATWKTSHYGGTLLATTRDPIVEQGVQQIRQLDNFCDKMTVGLCGVTSSGRMEIDPAAYGVTTLPAV